MISKCQNGKKYHQTFTISFSCTDKIMSVSGNGEIQTTDTIHYY